MSVYCLFCRTGREAAVGKRLAEAGLRVLPACVERRIQRPDGKWVRKKRLLFPGYVLFESAEEPDWRTLVDGKLVYRPVGNAGERALRGADLEFVRCLLRYDGRLPVSKARQDGERVKIIDGFLKDYEGYITQLNRRQRCAKVVLDLWNVQHTLWVSYDMLGE